MKKLFLVLVILAVAFGVYAQNYRLDPTYGSHNLSAGFWPDPYTIDLVAGGSIDASRSSQVNIYATGYVANAPDVDFYYQAGSYPLTIYVNGGRNDTVLLINGPDGTWYFNDDGHGGLDPEIVFRNPRSGLYSIWVGTYYSDEYVSVELCISEM